LPSTDLKAGPEMDAAIATGIFGLKEGVDFGTWPAHDWKRDEDGEIDDFAVDDDEGQRSVQCLRCGTVDWLGWYDSEPIPDGKCVIEPDPYSTNIAYAMKVVEALRQEGWLVRIQEMPDGYPYLDNMTSEPAFYAKSLVLLHWMPNRSNADHHKRMRTQFRGRAETPEEAICKVALNVAATDEDWDWASARTMEPRAKQVDDAQA
jgi:hypothetical protein